MKLLPSACLILFLATLAIAQCSESEKQTLEKFDHAWTDANARGDRAHLETVYADDYARTSLTGPATKTEIIEAAVRSAAQGRQNPQSVSKVTADHFIITCTANTATITHRTVVTSTDQGREQTFYSRGVHFLEKRNGSWKVVSLENHPLDDPTNLQMIQAEWNDAMRTKDAGWFERNLADEFTFVNLSSGAIQKKADLVASVKDSKSSLDSVESSELQARVANDLGVVTGMVQVKGRDENGQTLNYKLRYTMTFTKRDGRWLALFTQATRVQ